MVAKKLTTAARILKTEGVTGVYHIVLGKVTGGGVHPDLIKERIRRYDPYRKSTAGLTTCPHCHSDLHKTPEGLMCRRCQDIFV